jgi:hypothetical protein
MKRIVRSRGYARLRLVNASVFAVLGLAIVARTVTSVGLSLAVVPGIVLGLAMLALAYVRFRDYRDARRGP